MGVGYQVSSLHRVVYLDTAALRLRPIVRGENPALDTLAGAIGADTVADGPLPWRSPTIESILAWRQRLSSKYRDQLNEDLAWDECSTFETSEDVASSADGLLRYVAAVLDQRAEAGLKDLIGQRGPVVDAVEAVFREVVRRGFGGRFPQLLLGAQLWLPFERNLMIEEPDWNGKIARYSSVPRLIDEVTTIRTAIADADPSVVRFNEVDVDESELTLVAAWQTTATVLRLATLAAERHLPLSTTG
jgi:hypothetical protein